MPSLASLTRAWAESDSLLDELLAEMEPVFVGVRKQLMGAISGLPMAADGTLRAAPAAAKLIDQLNVERQILTGIGQAMPGAIDTARPLLSELGLAVPRVSRRAQLVFLAQAGEKVKDVLGSLNAGLEGLLIEAASTPIPARQLARITADLTDQPIAQARTISNTALSGLQRETTAQAAAGLPGGEGETYWLYMGPIDGGSRGFCRRCVDKAFSAAHLSQLRNGQGLPVRSYCGGYNCRHSLLPVTLAYLRAIGLRPATSADVSAANSAARR